MGWPLGRYFQTHVLIFMYFCKSHLCTCPAPRQRWTTPSLVLPRHHACWFTVESQNATFICIHPHVTATACRSWASFFIQCYWGITDIQYNVSLGSPDGSVVKNPPANAGDTCSVPGLGRFSGEGNATQSRILAWKIPWTEDPSGLYSPWSCKELDRTWPLNNNSVSLRCTA